MIAVIRGTGSYIPPRVVENEELKNYIETNDTWIRERTGIERRHVVTDDTVASMAVEAGQSSIGKCRNTGRIAGTDHRIHNKSHADDPMQCLSGAKGAWCGKGGVL